MVDKKSKKGFFQKRRDSISRGLGLSILMDAAKSMNDIVKGFLTVPYMDQRESFEQATRRLRLTPIELEKRRKNFLHQALLFLLFGFVALAYAIYLFSDAAWGSAIVVILMTAVFILYALRAHFWAFQIKHKKLGCTWKEWWNNKTTEEKQEIVKKE
ncbi:MAG: hypothetical protein ACHP9Y_04185 [Gammaproteobacteria bacterium]